MHYIYQKSYFTYIFHFINVIISNPGVWNKASSFSISSHDTNTDAVSTAIALVRPLSFLAKITPKPVNTYF